MSEIKLKPCPFCGNSDRRVGIRRMGNKGYRVVCGKCGGCGPYVAIKEWHDNKFIAQKQAIEAWNTRRPMERIVEQLEKQPSIEVYKHPLHGAYIKKEIAIDFVKAGGVDGNKN